MTPLGPANDWILTPQWSPDGRWIAFADERGGWADPASYEIYVMRADGSHVRRLTYDTSRANVFRAYEPSWSPDGRQIVFVRVTQNSPYQELVVVNVRTGRERTLRTHGPELPAWGAPGIAYVAGYSTIMVLDPATGRSRFFAHLGATGLAWSSRSVLAALEGNRILLYTASGRVLDQLAIPPGTTRACSVAWSRDGTRLLVSTSKKIGGLYAVAIATKKWQRLPLPRQATAPGSCAVPWR